MLTKDEQISNIKCRVANAAYTSLVEASYGIQTCSNDYTDLMRMDDMLRVELLEGNYDCTTGTFTSAPLEVPNSHFTFKLPFNLS